MSDLISRSKVISVLEQLEEHSLTGKMDISNAIYLLNNQPTTYDIDKVVDELETNKQNALEVEESIKEYNVWNEAIEIVKQGGVSDDVCEWKYNDTEYYFESSCDHLHIFMSDGPKENEYKYCPYCGKKIKVVE